MTASGRAWATAIASFLFASPAGAKCARLALDITGEVRGDPNHELTLRLETVPDANGKQPDPIRDADAFKARVLFDPTNGYSVRRGHDCPRDPRVVRIVLLGGERVLQQKELPFPDAFIELSPGTYQSREPVIVEAGARVGPFGHATSGDAE